MGSVAVIRSLGRAGYRVYACSDRRDALGLNSNFAHRRKRCPSVAADTAVFNQWLKRTVEAERIEAIVPSEDVLLAMRDDFAWLRSLIPYSRDGRVLYAGMSKCDLFSNFASPGLRERLPPFLLFEQGQSPPADSDLAALGAPLFVKTDAVHDTVARESAVFRAETSAEASRAIAAALRRYRRVLVQGFVEGEGVGAFLLRWNGTILARFMHRRLHEVPHTGGASSYREAWWNEAIFADAAMRAQHLRWQGVAMFEYRWNPRTGDFWLLELNGRFWGSLHLALFAGVDFPRLLLDAYFGRPESCDFFDHDTRSRWTFPREVEYVRSRVKDSSLSRVERLRSVFEFFALGFDPSIHSDLNFAGDRMLYLHGLRNAVRRWIGVE